MHKLYFSIFVIILFISPMMSTSQNIKENLIVNDSFENWVEDIPQNWTIASDMNKPNQISKSQIGHSGQNSLYITSENNSIFVKQNLTNFYPNYEYELGFWFEGDLTNSQIFLSGTWYGSEDTVISDFTTTGIGGNFQSWTLLSNLQNSPIGSEKVTITITLIADEVSIQIDDVFMLLNEQVSSNTDSDSPKITDINSITDPEKMDFDTLYLTMLPIIVLSYKIKLSRKN